MTKTTFTAAGKWRILHAGNFYTRISKACRQAVMPDQKEVVFDGWAPENRFLISSDTRNAIPLDAETLIIRRSIPAQNCFTLNLEFAGDGKRQLLSPGADHLSRLTLRDRLDVTGHGTSYDFEGKSPAQVAQYLHECGLRTVGVIKIRSCHAGEGDFLEKLAEELDDRGIKFGYLSGVTGRAKTLSTPTTILNRKVNVGMGSYVTKKSTSQSSTLERAVSLVVDKEAFHMRVVPGNAPISFKRTRYDIALYPEMKRMNRPLWGPLPAVIDAPLTSRNVFIGKPRASRVLLNGDYASPAARECAKQLHHRLLDLYRQAGSLADLEFDKKMTVLRDDLSKSHADELLTEHQYLSGFAELQRIFYVDRPKALATEGQVRKQEEGQGREGRRRENVSR